MNNNLFGFSDHSVNWSVNLNNFSVYNNFFNNSFDFNNSWNFDNFFNDFFLNSGHFNNFFNNTWDLDNLFLGIVYNFNDFNWDMNNFFNFLNSWYFDDPFNNFFNWNNLWNFNNFFNYFFNNLLNFHHFSGDFENFEDIINWNDSHDLLIDHGDDCFINIKDCTCFSFNFFKFFQQSFN